MPEQARKDAVMRVVCIQNSLLSTHSLMQKRITLLVPYPFEASRSGIAQDLSAWPGIRLKQGIIPIFPC